MPWPKGESRHARGYGYQWTKVRNAVLAEEPLCRPCQKAGKVTLARAVDHIRPKQEGGTDRRENLQPICHQCHKTKTEEEAARAQGRASSQPRPEYDARGWPIWK